MKRLLSGYDPAILSLMTGIMLANLLAAIDQTALTSALPAIARDLPGRAGLSWVVSIYLMAVTIFAPLYGKLGDLIGRTRILMTSILVFVGASMACGFATTLPMLIVARAVQGVGAAGLFSLPNAILADVIPARERGRYQVFISLVWMLASLAGPAFGGGVVDLLSWRAIFLVNLPIGAFALWSIRRTAPQSRQVRAVSLDGRGAFCLMAAIGLVLLGTETAGREGPLWSARLAACMIAAVLATAVLVWVERRVEEPILPPGLFRDRQFVLGNAVSGGASLCQLGILAFLPVHLQQAFGLDPFTAGAALAPSLVALPLSVVACARFTHRTGRYRLLPILGTGVMTGSLAVLAATTGARPLWLILLLAATFSGGSGMVGPTLLIAIQSATSKADVGAATSSFVVFRNLGGTLGTGIVGFLLSGNADGFRDACAVCAIASLICFGISLALEERELPRDLAAPVPEDVRVRLASPGGPDAPAESAVDDAH